MASHDLINTKPTILGATLGAIPGTAANPPEKFSFAPAFSERFFKTWGGPRAPEQNIFGHVSDSSSDPFSLFSNPSSYGIKHCLGAISFCRSAGVPPYERTFDLEFGFVATNDMPTNNLKHQKEG